MILRRLKHLWMASACLCLLSACQDSENDTLGILQESYLNISFTVDNGREATTRVPAGGENGDGREAGFRRENEVRDVTIILYQNTAGINATDAGSTTVDLVKHYTVTNVSRETQGTTYTDKTDEAVYTTGNQKIEVSDGLKLTNKYRVLVVANADLTSVIKKGDKLSTVRDYIYTQPLYEGTGIGTDAALFVMSSENDVVLDFGATGVKTTVKQGSQTQEFYSFTGIRVERLSARMDFLTSYGGGSLKAEYKAKGTGKNDANGYEYKVFKNLSETSPSSNDVFKLVAVVPFNVNKGSENLFKRISAQRSYDARNTASEIPQYLVDEDATDSWVLDAYSGAAKTSAAHPSYLINTLTDVQGYATDASQWLMASAVQSGLYQIGEADNIIVGYPYENTIDDNTPLYYYATGLALYGYYYKDNKRDDDVSTSRFVYYGYLRHQGEGTASYSAMEASSLNKTAKIGSSAPAMNYGVVRNNIYRININRVTEKGAMELSIKVKEWDPYIHEFIYM